IGILGCVLWTTMSGIPLGAPWYTVPKSGWSWLLLPQLAMRAAELGSTGALEMSVFHGLEAGKIWRPFRSGVPLPVAKKVTDVPPAVAVALEMKKVGLTRNDTRAWPEEFVVVLVAVTEPSVADHVTVTPVATVPLDLRTVTTSGLATSAP